MAKHSDTAMDKKLIRKEIKSYEKKEDQLEAKKEKSKSSKGKKK